MENNELPKIELPQYIEVNGRDELTANLLFLQQNQSQEPVYLLFKNGDQRSLLEVEFEPLVVRHFDLNGRSANNAIKGAISDVRDQHVALEFQDESLKHLLKVTDNGRHFGEGQLTEIPANFQEQLAHAVEMIATAKKEEALHSASPVVVPAGSSVGQFGFFALPPHRPGEKQPDAAQQETLKNKGNS